MDANKLLIDFCQSQEAYAIHTNQVTLIEGVNKYLESINNPPITAQNTWLKNINSESVPDLLEALKGLLECNDNEITAMNSWRVKGLQAISKATLTP